MLIYKIKINEKYEAFDAPKGGFSSRWEMVNPLFDLKNLGRTNTLQNSFPDTPHNDYLLGFAKNIDLAQHFTILLENCLVEWNGIVLRKGILVGTSKVYKSKNGYPLAFYADEREFFESIKNTNLQDLELQQYDEVFYTPGAAQPAPAFSVGQQIEDGLNNILAADEEYPTIDYTFPCVEDPVFYEFEENDTINYYTLADFYKGYLNLLEIDNEYFSFRSLIQESLITGFETRYIRFNLPPPYVDDHARIDSKLLGPPINQVASTYKPTVATTVKVKLIASFEDVVLNSGTSYLVIRWHRDDGSVIIIDIDLFNLDNSPPEVFTKVYNLNISLPANSELYFSYSVNDATARMTDASRIYIHDENSDNYIGYNINPGIFPYEMPTALVPMPYLSAMLKHTFNAFSFKSIGAFEENDNLKAIICYNNRELYDTVNGSVLLDWQGIPNSFDLADHCPAITVEALLIRLQQYFYGFFKVDGHNKTISFHFAQTILHKQPYADWTNNAAATTDKEHESDEYCSLLKHSGDDDSGNIIPLKKHSGAYDNISLIELNLHQPGEYILIGGSYMIEITEEKQGQIQFGLPGNYIDIYWLDVGPYIDDFDETDCEDEKEIELTVYGDAQYDLQYLHPYTRQLGNSKRYDQPEGEAALALGYYHGKRTLNPGEDYPFSTWQKDDKDFDLRLRTPDGIETTLGQEYIALLAAQTTIPRKIVFDAMMLKNIDWTNCIITLDRQEYIIKKLTGTLGNGEHALFTAYLVLRKKLF